MALSDCPKCWDTPCTCGYMFQHYSTDRRREIASAIYPQSNWIPVTEALPGRINGYYCSLPVLVWAKDVYHIAIAHYDRDLNFTGFIADYMYETPTHWQSLPRRPE